MYLVYNIAMEYFYYMLSRELNKKRLALSAIEEDLNHSPEGSLRCEKAKYGYKCFLRTVDKAKSSERKTVFCYSYLGKKNRSLAKELAKKRYDINVQRLLQKQIAAIEKCLDHYPKEDETDVYLQLPDGYKELLSEKETTLDDELRTWAAAPYDKDPNYPERLIQPARGGLTVRSKSEALIAGSLFEHEVPFHYEERLVLGDAELYPDFTIRHPRSGKVFYWEHFGLIDNDDYALSWQFKLSKYREYGIIPGINLICTYETADHPLNPDIVEAYVLMFFNN